VLFRQAAEAVTGHADAAVFQQEVAGHILLRLAGMPDAVTRVIVVIASRVIAGNIRQLVINGLVCAGIYTCPQWQHIPILKH